MGGICRRENRKWIDERLLLSFIVHPGLDFLGKVGGEEEDGKVGIGLEAGIAKHYFIDLGVVLDEVEFVGGDAAWHASVNGQRLLEGISLFAFFQNVEEQGPVLTLANGGHEEFAVLGGVVDGCEASYFVVALLLCEGEGGGHYDFSVDFAIVSTGEIGGEA